MSRPMRLAALISGGGSNLQAIINHCADNRIDADICAVFSNCPAAGGLLRATRVGIPTEVIDHRLFASRTAFETALHERLTHYQPHLLVLAGFMRILTGEFIRHYAGRILNIHPSLLPTFRGLNTHRRALDAGVDRHGASVHFVTPELDGGAVVLQASVTVRPDDTPAVLAERVLHREHIIYPRAIGWFAAGRLQYRGNGAWLDGKEMIIPISEN